MDSIILYEPGTAYYYKSEAALKIAAKLDSFYSMLVVFKILPTAFSDFIYD
jgi:predicted DCC family thiol-disulfide oxidoreductase YuxK